MDIDTVAFHAAEPCHLPFREAADVGIEILVHLLVGVVFGEVASDVFVFQSVFQETFFGYAEAEKPFDLFDHAILETLSESDADTFDYDIARKGYTHDEVFHFRQTCESFGIFLFKFLDFESPDEAFARFGIGVVVEFDKRGETCSKFLIAALLQLLSVGLVDRCVGQLVTTDNRFDIHARSAAEYGTVSTANDSIVCLYEIVLELVEVIFLAGIAYIDQMGGNGAMREFVFVDVFARTDIHAPEHLTRVGTDYFGVNAVSNGYSQSGLAACRGA